MSRDATPEPAGKAPLDLTSTADTADTADTSDTDDTDDTVETDDTGDTSPCPDGEIADGSGPSV